MEAELQNGNQSHEGQENVEEAIMAETSVRFRLTCPSPVSSGCLFKDLGYIADTEATTQILSGTYISSTGTDAFTTNLLLKVSLISKEGCAESVSLTITIDDFIYYSTGGAWMTPLFEYSERSNLNALFDAIFFNTTIWMFYSLFALRFLY